MTIALLWGLVGISQGVLPHSTPERQGISSAAVLAFVQRADSEIDAMHSFMLMRHGHIVAAGWWNPYDSATPHMLYSLSKSFTSTAVGLAISEGKLSLDDPVLKFFARRSVPQPPVDARARSAAHGDGAPNGDSSLALVGRDRTAAAR